MMTQEITFFREINSLVDDHLMKTVRNCHGRKAYEISFKAIQSKKKSFSRLTCVELLRFPQTFRKKRKQAYTVTRLLNLLLVTVITYTFGT